MTKPNITMNKVKKGKTLTGAGEFGGPRLGVEGMQRFPSASSSDNRRGEQAEDQACSSANTTGTRTRSVRRGSCGVDTPLLISEGSSSSEASPTSRGARAKRRKRTRASTTPPFSGATQGSNSESETSRAVFRAPPPPPSRSAKRLPTDEERMAELRHAPSANLAAKLEVADDLERIAVTSGNLKGTYIRRLRDDAGKARASATELAKRTTAAGAQVALEQENLQLRVRLQQAMEEITELREGRTPKRTKQGEGTKQQRLQKGRRRRKYAPSRRNKQAPVCP